MISCSKQPYLRASNRNIQKWYAAPLPPSLSMLRSEPCEQLKSNQILRFPILPYSSNSFLIPPFLSASIIPVAIAISPLPFNSQNRAPRTLEMRRRGVPKLVQFWDPFLRGFGPQNGPQNGSQIGKNHHNFGVHFWIPFF